MAFFNSKFKVKVAQSGKTHVLPLDCDHLTTSNFMELSPVYYRELPPTSKLLIEPESFARLNPLPLPPMARAFHHINAYWVPFRTVWKGWNDFYAANGRVGENCPMFMYSQLLDAIINTKDGSETPVFCSNVKDGGTSGNYDFAVYSVGTTTYYYYKFTWVGRHLYKILRTLGYTLPVGATEPNDTYPDRLLSAMPLLCFAKVLYDWFVPSQYVSSFNWLNKLFNLYDTYKFTVHDGGETDLSKLLMFFCVLPVTDQGYSFFRGAYYDNDYFTSAFDNQDGPNDDSSVEVRLNVSPQGGAGAFPTEVISDEMYNNNPILIQDNASSGGSEFALSQFMLNSLQALSNFMKRNQLAGSRAVDRFLARFGVTLDSAKVDRSVHLGYASNPFQFDTVDSNATVDGGSSLGDYAGKGFNYLQKKAFNIDSGDEFGCVLLLSSFIPSVGYVQGFDRHIYHISPLDYYTPEFDSVGNQAIAKGELYSPTDPNVQDWNQTFSGIFGFTPRYSEYKVARDMMTGDFSLFNTIGKTLQGWHLNRLFDRDTFNSMMDCVHSLGFVSGFDSSQYDRIFYTDDPMEDKITVIYRFHVKLTTQMKDLYDQYHFDDSTQSSDVTMDVNGVKNN